MRLVSKKPLFIHLVSFYDTYLSATTIGVTAKVPMQRMNRYLLHWLLVADEEFQTPFCMTKRKALLP